MTLVKNTGSEPEETKPQEKSVEQSTNEALMAKVMELTDKVAQIQKGATITSPGGLNENDIAKIAAIVAQTQQIINPKNIDYEAGIAEEEIPIDDWDEKGVRFCCPLTGFLIQDDVRKGHRVKLPYNKKEIFFDYAGTRRTRTGKYEQLAPLSVYRSHSKKLTQWLREHTRYGIMFYETSTEAINADASKAIRLSSIMKALQPLELHDLFKRCTEYGLELSEDASVMRGNLAYAMIQKEIDKEAELAKKTLDETYKSSKLLGRE